MIAISQHPLFSNQANISTRRRSARHRVLIASAALSAVVCLLGQERAMAATVVTSNGAPTGADISQPDFSNTNPVGWEDFSDNGSYNGGPGQTFKPATNFTLNSITFKGIGTTGSNGGSLAGDWSINVGTVNNNNPFWGQGITSLDLETFSGAPISADVANGIKTNYDTVTLATPLSLNAGTVYYFAIHGPANCWYGFASSTGDTYTGGTSIGIDPNAHTMNNVQGNDRTFFINGTPTILSDINAQWKTNGDGTWALDANWDPNAPPTSGSTATFGTYGGTITANPTVTVGAARTIKQITFDKPSGGYTLSGAGSISLSSEIDVLSGNHTISVPLTLSSGNIFNIASGSSLTVGSANGGGFGSIYKHGAGTLTIGGMQNVSLNITSTDGGVTSPGTVVLTDGTLSLSYLYGISIDTGGTLNLGVNSVQTNGIYGGPNGSGTLIIPAGGSIYDAQHGDNNVTDKLVGAGSFLVGGGNAAATHTATLSGTNTGFSGTVTATTGTAGGFTVAIGSGANLGDGSATNQLILDGGIVKATADFAAPQNVSITANSGTVDTNSHNISFGVMTGSGGLTKIGLGDLAMAGSNTYAGNTTVNAGSLTLASGGSIASPNVTVAAGATANINGLLTGTPAVTANGAVNAGANAGAGILARTWNSLTIGNGGMVSLANPTVHASRTVLTTGSLVFAGATGAWQGKLDLGGNDLVIHNASGAAATATAGNVADQLKQGFNLANSGFWNGSAGIVSSAAAADASHLTTLGTILNNDGTGATIYGTFDGQTVTNTDVLVKYTYFGDADLSGKVDGTDYSKIDNGFNNHLTGWFNGDFNYDGVVDGSDYSLIDNAFNTQGASLGGGTVFAAEASSMVAASTSEPASVPEPTAICTLLGSATLLMSRRRRKQ